MTGLQLCTVSLSSCIAGEEKQNCVIETSRCKLFVVGVSNQERAVKVCERLVKEEGIHSVVLLSGFTHKNITEIAEAAGENVGVFVAS